MSDECGSCADTCDAQPSTLIEMQNPVMSYLRQDRIPHIWCPGCGIGTTLNCFVRALEES